MYVWQAKYRCRLTGRTVGSPWLRVASAQQGMPTLSPFLRTRFKVFFAFNTTALFLSSLLQPRNRACSLLLPSRYCPLYERRRRVLTKSVNQATRTTTNCTTRALCVCFQVQSNAQLRDQNCKYKICFRARLKCLHSMVLMACS